MMNRPSYGSVAKVAALGLLAVAASTGLAFAEEAATAAAEVVAAAPTPVPNKGDTAWLLISTALVLMMSIPGLALFYGGLVRSKNMLSVLTQVFMIVSLVSVIWVLFGYSLAFTEAPGALNPFIGGFSKVFLAGITPDSAAATF